MAHWRNTYKPARFFFLDVRVGVVILASLIHIRFWTIALDVVVIFLGWWIERIGLGFMGALRAAREWVAGPIRPALPMNKVRRKVDFARRKLPWAKEPEKGKHVLQPVDAVKRSPLH